MQFLLENAAGTPVLLFAVGVPLLGVPQPDHVGVARVPVVAANLLESVGHWEPPWVASLTVLMVQDEFVCVNVSSKSTQLKISKKVYLG